MSATNPCRLVDLPAEIRNLIYQYARVNYATEVTFVGAFRGYHYDPRRSLEDPVATLDLSADLQGGCPDSPIRRPSPIRSRLREHPNSAWVRTYRTSCDPVPPP